MFNLGFSSWLSLFFTLSVARTNSYCLLAFFTLHVTAPDVSAFTSLLDFPLKRVVTAATAHVRTATLTSGLRVTLSARSSQSSSRFALPTVVRGRVQGNKVPGSVAFSSPRSQHVLITALGLADHVDDGVVFLLEERGNVFEIAQASEARFSLARSGHAMASADNCHLVSNSL